MHGAVVASLRVSPTSVVVGLGLETYRTLVAMHVVDVHV